ncbi:MAG TPA: hypothetical protein PLD02_06640, partial [Saprospiraceae bacterium]|nr:hypothetical protein [Saprospiraceae bacterium]
SGKNVPLLRTAQAAKNIIHLLFMTNIIRSKKLIPLKGLDLNRYHIIKIELKYKVGTYLIK